MESSMLVKRDRRTIRCEYVQVHRFHHLRKINASFLDVTFAPYLKSFGCQMGNQVFEEKACYTLFAEFLAHPKAQDISDLF